MQLALFPQDQSRCEGDANKHNHHNAEHTKKREHVKDLCRGNHDCHHGQDIDLTAASACYQTD